ncbi:MAG: BA14K family protein [Rhizobiaceae bacterium]|nr:BA14K family protein [Rhizobiaceae bacterium]
MSALFAVSSIVPAAAGPIMNMSSSAMPAQAAPAETSGVTQVQYRHHRPVVRPGHRPPGHRPPAHRPNHRPNYHPGHRPNYHPGHRPGYWNGHRGYHYARPGYRRYSDGWWYPAAAFTAGVIVGGAVASQPVHSSSHVQWCSDRYRSYRVSDNTYQPNSGPRRQCVSP